MDVMQIEIETFLQSQQFIKRDSFFCRKNGNCFQAIYYNKAISESVYIIVLPYWLAYCSLGRLYLSLNDQIGFWNHPQSSNIISYLCLAFGIDISNDIMHCEKDSKVIDYLKRILIPFFNKVNSDDSYLSAMINLNRIIRIPQELILNKCNKSNDIGFAREWVNQINTIDNNNNLVIAKRLLKNSRNGSNAFNPGWNCNEDVLEDVEEITSLLNDSIWGKLYYSLDRCDTSWFENDYRKMEIEGKNFFCHFFEIDY